MSALAFALSAPVCAAASRVPTMRMSAAEAAPRKALWKPGEIAPAYLDGSLPGDAGFDPECLVALANKPVIELISGAWPTKAQRSIIVANMTPGEQKAALDKMRDAEIKHARLAMLAAVGWPLAELLNPWIALDGHNGRAPSLFNGGLGDGVIPFFIVLAAGGAAYLEYVAEEKVNQQSRLAPIEPSIAGDYGFDPLGFSKEEGAYRQRELRANELFNGRLAMLAITGFAVQEFVYSKPVVAQTPWFFGH